MNVFMNKWKFKLLFVFGSNNNKIPLKFMFIYYYIPFYNPNVFSFSFIYTWIDHWNMFGKRVSKSEWEKEIKRTFTMEIAFNKENKNILLFMCKKIHQFIKRKNCNHCYLVKILFFIMSLYQNIFIFDKAVSFMFAKWKEINLFFSLKWDLVEVFCYVVC